MNYDESNKQSKKIAVIGAGSWGTALALSCIKANHDVCLVTRRQSQADSMIQDGQNKEYFDNIKLPETLKIKSLENLDYKFFLQTADYILLVVPAQKTRSILSELKPDLGNKPPIILCAKGLEIHDKFAENPVFQSTIACDVLGDDYPIAVLSGPNFAREIALNLPAATTIASSNMELATLLAQNLKHNHLRVYANNDPIGVQVGGALKNVYAIASGIIQGLNLGANASVALMTRALAEMNRFGVVFGANSRTFMGLSGVGDLFMTCSFEQSRNMRFGKLLASGNNCQEVLQNQKTVVEGFYTAQALLPIIKHHNIRMPIATAIYDILIHNKSIKDAIGCVLSDQVSLSEFD